MYKQIERAGRVCYKSENNATPDSAQPFVERMMKSKHTAMLEHGTVYLKGEGLEKYKANKFSHYKHVDGTDYVTTNLRVLEENGWMDDLQLFCETMALPSARILRSTLKSFSVSCGVRTAVGSSRISVSAPR